jgi:hypothetical protein
VSLFDNHHDGPYSYDPDRHMYQIGTVEYDVEKGELHTISGGVEELVRVRAELQEKVLRQAVIFELEKLGYTVISPDGAEQ